MWNTWALMQRRPTGTGGPQLSERGLLGSGDERYIVRGVDFGLVAGAREGEGEEARDRLDFDDDRMRECVFGGDDGAVQGAGVVGSGLAMGLNTIAGFLGVESTTGWDWGNTAATCAGVTRWPARFCFNFNFGRGGDGETRRGSTPAAVAV